ncbi:MAG: GLPGLI family protein [Chitinophagaceae bacterium]|nr:GLPGLI family protein [Chitinophagaceae bacterium]
MSLIIVPFRKKSANTLRILFTLSVLSFAATAQTDEPIQYAIKYKFVHIDDTTKPTMPVRSSMLLRVSKSISRYGTIKEAADFDNARSSQNNLSAAATDAQSVVGQPLAIVPINPLENETIYQLISKKMLVKLAIIFAQEYIVEQPAPVFNWRILPEQKKIGNYVCQKAAGTFAGRNYTAWFAPALPFSVGPWKLGGLPGLILEAADQKNQVQFLFDGFQETSGQLNSTKIGFRPVKISDKQLEKAKSQFNKDPGKTAQSMLGSGDDATVSVVYQGYHGEMLSEKEAQKLLDEQRKKTINNPIELIKQ